MRHFQIHVRSAGLNVPKDFDPRSALECIGLPFSTVNGLIHVLFGQRPPSRRQQDVDFSVPLLSMLARNSFYQFVKWFPHDLTQDKSNAESLACPKFESYFSRESGYKDIKNAHINETLLLSGVGINFVTGIKDVFAESKAVDAFLEFKKACDVIYGKKGDHNEAGYQLAEERLQDLRTREKLSGENWRLSPGYLSPFYSKHWIKRPDSFGRNVQLGSGGAPKRKFVFDLNIFSIIPDDVSKQDLEWLYQMLQSAPATASFGEGGLAWIETLPFDGGTQCFDEGFLPDGYLPFKDIDGALFEKLNRVKD